MKKLNLETVLQDAYNSEINLDISWMYDGGIDVVFDDYNTQLVEKFADMSMVIVKELCKMYPGSDFEKKYKIYLPTVKL